MTEATFYRRGIVEEYRVITIGKKDIISRDGSFNEDSIQDLVEGMSLFADEHNNKLRAVVIGEGVLEDGLIEEIERVYQCEIYAGTCLAKPYEDLPPERVAYIEALGILDHIQREEKKKRIVGSPIKKVFNRAMLFIDKYF